MSFPSFLFRFVPRVARIIGLLSLAVALGGCSAIKLGYSNLPELAYWWLDGYLDFDDAQRPRVREDLAQLQAWHRANELPQIGLLLVRLEKMAPGDITAAQACALEAPVRERLAAVRERIEPVLVTTAVTLTPAQLQHLERKYVQNNREFQREWVQLSPRELEDKRVKALVERAETVYGSLDDSQRDLLRQQLQGSPYKPAIVLAERQLRQQQTLAVLRRLTGSPMSLQDSRKAINGLVERYVSPPDAAYRNYVDAVRQESCRLGAAVHNSTSAAQREAAVRRFRGWQRDLGELAANR